MTLHRVYQTSGSISARVIYRYENKGIDCGEMVITDGFWLSQKCMRKTNAAKREKKKQGIRGDNDNASEMFLSMPGRVKGVRFIIYRKKKSEAGAVP